MVKKTRIEKFEEGKTFPFSYNEIAERYGRAILEKDAQVEKLATKDQVLELTRLVNLLKISEDITEKWLSKAQAETYEEMEVTAIQKCIEYLKSKINDTPMEEEKVVLYKVK